jgi:hypothetical protein
MLNALILALVAAPIGETTTLPSFTMKQWLNAAKPVKLRDYRGKVVVLHVNPGFC